MILKTFIYGLLSLIPFLRRDSYFVTVFSKKNSSGPARFLSNLENSASKYGIRFERFFIRRSKVALILLKAPSLSFYNLCQLHGVRIVLRVDGFYNPVQFNNAETGSGFFQSRNMTESRIELNYGMQIALLKADWVVYQSEFSKEMLDKFLYRRTHDYSIIPNGVNLSHFQPQENVLGKRVLIFGTLRDLDAFACSLDAFLHLSKRASDVSLRIVGSMTEEVDRYFSRWLESNQALSARVEALGSIGFDSLPQVISECMVSISIKSGDWCPNAVLETLACGVPVVCQRFGGTSEIVGKAGVVIDAQEYCYDSSLSEKILVALEEIIDNHPMYKALAIERSGIYDMEKITSLYLDVLSKHAKG